MDVNRKINELLILFQLPVKDHEEISEYLEHNEWGVALEYLISTLLNESIEISVIHYLQINELGEYMELEARSWEELKLLIK